MKFMYLTALKYIDWKLFVITLLIISLSLATIYSLTINQENPDYTKLTKQLIALGLGSVILLVLAHTSYKLYSAIAWWLYILGNLALVLVLFFGKNLRGTKGWFEIAGFSFQPVEVMKIILVITLAHFFSKNIQYRHSWQGWVYSFFIILPPSVLLIFQPDFGPILIFGVLWLVFCLLVQTNKKFIWIMVLAGIMVGVLGWQFVVSDYHKERIGVFLSPNSDPLGQGYNIRQSIIAIGSGRLFGRGLGLGTQSQLKFLPETTTDFIFAVVAEELGLLGIVILLALFGLLFQRFYKAINNVKDDFGQFLLVGFTVILFTQVIINIGMNIGLLPVTGLALPLLSYGGSYLLLTLGLVGIVENIIIYSKKSI